MGGDAWQQRDDGGYPEFEDWADIFSNHIVQNFNRNDNIGKQVDDYAIDMNQHVGIQ